MQKTTTTCTASRYRQVNRIAGWAMAAMATTVYLLTLEPTASFWDCGEFIASGNRLEVGHPCGAPLFMLLVRFFTMFAPSAQLVPVLANALSALASGLTIMFLFWSIAHLAKKLVPSAPDGSMSWGHLVATMGAAAVGALAYTFSDTFWFSAVEGEVYATSSLFTALVFWAILRWEECAHEPYANRWLVLIAYLMGLSIGVHLLNLLAIPAIALVYYFKKYPYSFKGLCITIVISGAMLLVVLYGIIQGVVLLASKFELLLVNGLGMPIMSGVLVLGVALVGMLAWGLATTHRRGKVLLNTVLLGFAVILIGYSSYTAVVVRSLANPPMDQNSPDNMFSLLYYLNREQYGDRPLLYGQTFPAQAIERQANGAQYAPKDGRYVEVRKKYSLVYPSEHKMLLPRMFSPDPSHVEAYKQWSSFKGRPVKGYGPDGQPSTIYVPTMAENLRFLLSYQIGFMYMRYFMWNFAGRQNDIQGHGDCLKGNWISGIGPIDNARLGPQHLLPSTYAANKGRNRYFMLPLLLGIAGMAFQMRRHQPDFWVVMALFFMTGIAIVLYLNQTPYQPRERDYAYAGSFYAFAIWIGLGALALYNLAQRISSKPAMAAASTALCMAVPAIMAAQNWDDHDRSHSYLPADFGYNMLIGCKPNAVLFTYGDNDTFPLWYNQEVEGVRTDVRVANLSYLHGDWYIAQMQRKAHQSDPLPLQATFDKYYNSKRDAVLVYDKLPEPISLPQAIDFWLSDNPATELPSPFEPNARVNYIPSSNLFLPVDSAQVASSQTLPPHRMSQMLDTMRWKLSKRMLTKQGQVIYDLLANNHWQRPIYFGTTVASETYHGLDRFFELEGMMHRVVPVQTKHNRGVGAVNADQMYTNIMEKYRFRGLNHPRMYIDETKSRTVASYRSMFARLAHALIDQGENIRAVEVLDRCLELMPPEVAPLNYLALSLVEAYYRAGHEERATQMSTTMAQQASDELRYLLTAISPAQRSWLSNDARISMAILQNLWQFAQQHHNAAHAQQLSQTIELYYPMMEQPTATNARRP
ncbi:MAG: DUF2723 domain-containing protein [Bacteroidales bacterium]|nr:DUF2723 domain-containing protein [Bacteroidales bacterium]